MQPLAEGKDFDKFGDHLDLIFGDVVEHDGFVAGCCRVRLKANLRMAPSTVAGHLLVALVHLQGERTLQLRIGDVPSPEKRSLFVTQPFMRRTETVPPSSVVAT